MDEMGCQTCHRKLSRVQRPDGSIYYDHPPTPGAPKHEVVPIHLDAGDLVEVCDFCLAPNPPWTIPLLEHATTVLAYRDLDVTSVDDDALWGACDECAELIRTRSIGKLRNRALAVAIQKFAPEPLPDYAKESVLLQLAAFWASVPGPVTPA